MTIQKETSCFHPTDGLATTLYNRVMVNARRLDNGCLIAEGNPINQGYAHISLQVNGKRLVVFAHRLVKAVSLGATKHPRHDTDHYNCYNKICGLEVHHECGNKACCEDTHLMVLTPGQHFRRDRSGASNPKAILKETDVIEIRKLYRTGWYTQKELGDRFGVTREGISGIVNRRIWKNI